MFYSNQILARKGPLGLVWIAAHMDRQLKRQQINSTSIPASVDTLLDPEVPLALRLSGQLLLGVVRIYARKVSYLQQDCDAALVKIRVVLRPADGVNLPPGSQVAPMEAITLIDPAAAARARKARAAKAAAEGRNNAAAGGQGGGAAAVDGWLGPVDEDGQMLGLDDIVWEDELLLGEGAEAGFGVAGLSRFEPNSRLSFGLAPSRSGLGSEDISGVFGMYSSQDELQEAFDVEDAEAAAMWDLDEVEVERLRAAPSQSQPDSSGLQGGDVLGGIAGAAAGVERGTTPAGSMSAGAAPWDHGLTPDSAAGAGLMQQDQGHAGLERADAPGPDEGADMDMNMELDMDIDPGAVLPSVPAATPQVSGGGGGGGGGGGEGGQQDPYDLEDLGDPQELLPDIPAAQEGAEGASAAADSGMGPAGAAAHEEGQEGPSASKDGPLQQQQQQGPGMEQEVSGEGAACGEAAAGDDMAVDEAAEAAAAGQGPATAEAGGIDGGQEGAAGAANTLQKTFVRRNTRQAAKQQQQQEEEQGKASAPATPAAAAAAADGTDAADAGDGQAGDAPKTAAKSARRRRASVLLGAKRRVVVDAGPEGGSTAAAGRAGGARHTPTELPAADIRALLQDRGPLMDLERARKACKQLQQQAASSLTAQGAAALAQQQLLHITAASAAADSPPGASAVAAAAAAAAAAAGGPAAFSPPALASSGVAAAAEAVVSAAFGTPIRRVGTTSSSRRGAELPAAPTAALPGAGISLAAGFAGGLGLPPQLQGLLQRAAAGAAAATAVAAAVPAAARAVRAEGGAAAAAAAADAVAATAPLEEIGGFVDDDDVMEGEGLAGGGVLNPGLVAGATRVSLSLTRTPGSAAASGEGCSGGMPGATPGDAAAAAAGGVGTGTPATVEGGEAAEGTGHAPGLSGFTPGGDGYTPGTAGLTPGSELNPTQQQQQQQATTEPQEIDDVLQPLDDVNHGHDDINLMAVDVGPEDELEPAAADGDDKENTPRTTAGKRAAAALGARTPSTAAGGSAGATAGGFVWPADAETLLEQDAAEHAAHDGSFTSRTRLVVRHLQQAAATAAAAAGGAGSSGGGLTPAVGSKRRISAAAAGMAAPAAADKGAGSLPEGPAAVLGPALSFDGLTKGHNRLDACRWFYEVLVLGNKGLVKLEQEEPYGDIRVTPNLAAMARV